MRQRVMMSSTARNVRRVMGVDPGFDRLGIAIIEGDSSRPTWVWSACILPPKGGKEERLAAVQSAIEAAITAHSPDSLAIETLFFSTNRKTALGVAEARGVILATCAARGMSVQEFSPQTVKLAVTGYGASDKKAIAGMIPHLITLPPLSVGEKRLDDELDAIAVAIAGLTTK